MHGQLANELLKGKERRVSFTQASPSYMAFTPRPTTPYNANEDTIVEPTSRVAPLESSTNLSTQASLKYILKKNNSNQNLSKQLNSTVSESNLKTLKQIRIEQL